MGTEVNLLTNLAGTPSELHRDELYNHRR